jgi:hypothetical protein
MIIADKSEKEMASHREGVSTKGVLEGQGTQLHCIVSAGCSTLRGFRRVGISWFLKQPALTTPNDEHNAAPGGGCGTPLREFFA